MGTDEGKLSTRADLVNLDAEYQRIGIDGSDEGAHNATGRVVCVSAGTFLCSSCEDKGTAHEHVGLRVDLQHTDGSPRVRLFFCDDEARKLAEVVSHVLRVRAN